MGYVGLHPHCGVSVPIPAHHQPLKEVFLLFPFLPHLSPMYAPRSTFFFASNCDICNTVYAIWGVPVLWDFIYPRCSAVVKGGGSLPQKQ